VVTPGELEFLLPPWRMITDASERAALERELAREVQEGHRLWRAGVQALARRDDQDDVFFAVDATPPVLAIVHLTWHAPEAPPWPHAVVYARLDELRDHIREDHRAWSDDGSTE
jgi:hypothetical protein